LDYSSAPQVEEGDWNTSQPDKSSLDKQLGPSERQHQIEKEGRQSEHKDKTQDESSSFSQVNIKNQYNNIIEFEDDNGNVHKEGTPLTMIGHQTKETPGVEAQNLLSSMSEPKDELKGLVTKDQPK
jgi:hypothetical protein